MRKKKNLQVGKLHKWLSVLGKRIGKWIASVKKSIHLKISTVISYIKFYVRYYTIVCKNRISYWLHRWIFSLIGLSIIYFVILTVISVIIGKYIMITPNLFKPDTLTYFIGLAAMIGGIIAIIFPFKILIMQHAADNTSAGFYRTLGKDKRQDIVLFVMIASAIFFAVLSLTAASHQFSFLNQRYDLVRILFQASIFIVGFDFYLLFLLFEMLFDRTDPFSGIAHIQKTSLKFLDEVYKKAVRYSELMKLHPKTDKNTTKEELLAASFQSLRMDLQYISYNLNYLFDYHDKVLGKNERTASLAILDVITSILNKYFIIRKDSSILLPSGFYFVSSSDSQSFLTPHIESLVSVGENYLKKEDSVAVKKIILIFQTLIGYAGEIKFVRSRIPDNPILMQLRGYLDQYMNVIMQKGLLEGMFQGAITYGVIGAIIMRKKMLVELTPVLEMLNKIAYAALLKRQDVVVSEVINSYSALFSVLAEDDWLFDEKLKIVLKHLQETVIYGYASHNSRSIPHGRMQQELAEPYRVLANLIIQKAESVASIRDPRKKEDAKSLVIDSANEVRMSIRELAENLKNADSLLIGILADTTRRIGSLLIDLTTNPNWEDAKRALEREGSAYLHQPWWFIASAEKIDDSLSFDDIPEAVSKMGLVALEANQDSIADDATKVLKDIATAMLTKEDPPGYGHTEQGVMTLACYLGIYALKLGKRGIVANLKTRISEFETAFIAKYFVDPRADLLTFPRRDQLMIEVVQFRDEITNLNRVDDPLPQTKELIITRVTVEDVNNFIREIWGVDIS